MPTFQQLAQRFDSLPEPHHALLLVCRSQSSTPIELPKRGELLLAANVITQASAERDSGDSYAIHLWGKAEPPKALLFTAAQAGEAIKTVQGPSWIRELSAQWSYDADIARWWHMLFEAAWRGCCGPERAERKRYVRRSGGCNFFEPFRPEEHSQLPHVFISEVDSVECTSAAFCGWLANAAGEAGVGAATAAPAETLDGFVPADTLWHDYGIKASRLSEKAREGKVHTKNALQGMLDSQGRKIRKLYSTRDAIAHCNPTRVTEKTRQKLRKLNP